jgi:ribonucleotide monophosphatase NagD (HAD superfamily)
VSAAIGDKKEAQVLIAEADELTRIFVASGKTAARNQDAAKHRQSAIHNKSHNPQ